MNGNCIKTEHHGKNKFFNLLKNKQINNGIAFIVINQQKPERKPKTKVFIPGISKKNYGQSY